MKEDKVRLGIMANVEPEDIPAVEYLSKELFDDELNRKENVPEDVNRLLEKMDIKYGRQRAKTPKMKQEDVSARVLDCINNGAPVVAIKAFVSHGTNYQPGDVVQVNPDFTAVYGKLAAHGYIIPGVDADSARLLNEIHEFIFNKVDGKRQRLANMRSNRNKLAAAAAECEIHLRDAMTKLQDADGEVAGAEEELRQLLTGPDAERLFN